MLDLEPNAEYGIFLFDLDWWRPILDLPNNSPAMTLSKVTRHKITDDHIS